MSKRLQIAILGGFNITTVGLLGLLGPVITPIVFAALAVFVYCVLSPLGVVLITVLTSHVAEIPGAGEGVSYAIKWGVTILFFLLILSRWIQDKVVVRYQFGYVEKFFIMMSIWVAICALFSERSLITLIESGRIMALWMVYAMTRLLISQKSHVGAVLLAILLAVVSSSLFSFINLQSPGYSRAAGFLVKANPYGTFLGFTIPLLAYAVYYYRHSLLKYVYVGSLAIGMAALFYSWTRAAWFSIAAQLVVFAIIEKKKKWLAAFGVVLLAGLVVLISSVVYSTAFSNLLRLSSGTSHRTIRWEKSLEAVAYSPVFGYGFNYRNEDIMHRVYWGGIVEATVFSDREKAFDPHNVYLHTLLYCGIPGFIIFMALCWRMLRERYRQRFLETSQDERILHSVVFVILIGALVNGFFERNLVLGQGATNNYLWIAWGIADAVREKRLFG